MKMKRVFYMLLALIFMISTGACSGNGNVNGTISTAGVSSDTADNTSGTGNESTIEGSSEITDKPVMDLTPESKKIKVSWFIPWWEKAEQHQFVFDEFARKYPGYELDYSVVAGDIQQLAASIQAGTQADIWFGGDPNWAQYVTAAYQNLLMPLDDYLNNDPDFNFDNINKKVMGMTRFVDNKYYAVPYEISVHCLVWNKDVFAKAGLDPEKPPETWSQFYENAKMMTRNDSNGVPVQLGFFGNPDNWIFLSLRKQYVVSEDGTKGRYTEPWIRETDEFCGKFDKLYGGPDKLPQGVEFSVQKGNAGMQIGNLGSLIALTQSSVNFGFSKLPRPDDFNEQVVPGFLWQYVGIPKGAQNPKGGWLFLKYALTDLKLNNADKQFQENPSRWVPNYIIHEPTRKKAYDLYLSSVDPDVRELITRRDALIDEINYYYPASPLKQRSIELSDKWGQKLVKGEINAYEFYENLQNEFQAELEQWKKDMINKGWQFPENGAPVPPANF